MSHMTCRWPECPLDVDVPPTWDEWRAATATTDEPVTREAITSLSRLLAMAHRRLDERDLARSCGERWPKAAA